MASTKEWSLIYLAMLIFTCTAGIMVNLFIVAVDFPNWLRGRKIKTCEKVQCVLALSRICYLCISLIRVFIAISGKGNQFPLNDILTFIHISNNYTGLWYLTLLSVLFFMKIVDCKHALFLRLKAVMSRKLMYFIAGVTLISVCSSPMRVWGVKGLFEHSQQHNLTNVACKPDFDVSNIYAAAVGNCGPFIIYSVSSITLVTSLSRHVRQMRSGDTNLSSRNLDRYYIAVKSLTVCLLIYALHVAANVLAVVYFSCLGISGFFVLLNLFPNLHSVCMIYRNPKLRQQFPERMQAAANCFYQRRH
uniref:Taste receptor type 2 n=1 Tax=Leptobrachium leishanense TaxID=445787 RepID=A0A8C5MKD5_9ANUR